MTVASKTTTDLENRKFGYNSYFDKYYVNTAPVNPVQEVSIDGANADAFSRVRVSNPTTLFDSNFQYDINPILFSELNTNGGALSHLPNYSSALLSIATQSNSTAVLCSRSHFRYQPGKSQLIFITGVFGSNQSGSVKRCGYYNLEDGIFLESSDQLYMVRRTSTSGSPVDNKVPQSSWSYDKLDGTGPSGIVLDKTKCFIFSIDLQWLGMGRVRTYFDIGGRLILVHEFLHSNILTVPYIKTANLPIRWEISGNTADTFIATCCAVISEGGFEDERGYSFSSANAADVTAASGVRTPIIAIRPRATMNGVSTKGTHVEVVDKYVLNGSSSVLFEVIYNPTITGGTWADADPSSIIEVNKTMTSVSGGIPIDSFFVANGQGQSKQSAASSQTMRMPICLDSLTNLQIPLVLCATGIGGTSAIRAALSWREIR